MSYRIVFDNETTALMNAEATDINNQPRIFEFAAIKFDYDWNEVGRLEFMCDPGTDIPDDVTKITGVKTEDVKGKPKIIRFMPQVQEFFLGVTGLIGHNVQYDVDVLKCELIRLGLLTKFPWPPEHFCTVEMTYHINGGRLSLTKLHQHCFSEGFVAHRAMNDVEALVRCIKHLVAEEEIAF